MIQLRVSWTPDGPIVERLENGTVVATASYPSIDGAIEGVRMALEMLEKDYLFPGMTDAQIEMEMLARGFEDRLHEKYRAGNGSA